MSVVALARYDAAIRALADAKSVDEAKDIRDKAEAMRAYARQANNKQLEVDAAEIRLRAERRLGELLRLQHETVGMNPGTRGQLVGRGVIGGAQGEPPISGVAECPRCHSSYDAATWNPSRSGGRCPYCPPTLAEAGISKKLSVRAQALAAVPVEEFEEALDEWRGRVEEESERVTTNLLRAGEKHVRGTFGTGENEWYTPARYIEAARAALGGEIDLDPASSFKAQATVKAAHFYDEATDGLAQEWAGRVWMNPPYAQPYIEQFVRKLVGEVEAGRIVAAVALTHNYTDTSWFHCAAEACSALCFTRGRIRFVSPEGVEASPTQGQAFFYFGNEVDRFRRSFADIGFVVRR